MDVSLFDYDLPREMIAREPVVPRDSSRLLILHKDTGNLEHRGFADIITYLQSGDLLVLNDTRVIPARVTGHRATGGKVDMLFLEPTRHRREGQGPHWTALGQAKGRLVQGETLLFENGEIRAEILNKSSDGIYTLGFQEDAAVEEMLERSGAPPLPVYVLRVRDDHSVHPDDVAQYQTVYARQPGAVAAPTSGLHFTEKLLRAIEHKGVQIASVTLHIGFGTFQPVREERVEDHVMHRERYSVSEQTAEELRRAKADGRRVVAVGTTTTRVLETIATRDRIEACSGSTDLFIYPPYKFRMVDALITNFHLPRSTLLMMVSAFAGRERIFAAYEEAKRKGYRFYSYGDAMFICLSRS